MKVVQVVELPNHVVCLASGEKGYFVLLSGPLAGSMVVRKTLFEGSEVSARNYFSGLVAGLEIAEGH